MITVNLRSVRTKLNKYWQSCELQKIIAVKMKCSSNYPSQHWLKSRQQSSWWYVCIYLHIKQSVLKFNCKAETNMLFAKAVLRKEFSCTDQNAKCGLKLPTCVSRVRTITRQKIIFMFKKCVWTICLFGLTGGLL